MGRIKTQLIKRNSKKIFAAHQAEFTTDFTKNKVILDKNRDIASKKLRNVIAGYITRLAKQQE